MDSSRSRKAPRRYPISPNANRLSNVALHTGGVHTNSGGNWNGVWDEFFKENPNATRQEILDQLSRMRSDFGI